jgi:hypothetical protein
MILGRPFLVTAWTIINVDQGEIINRSGEDYIIYRVSGQYNHLRQMDVSKGEANLKVENHKESKEPEGQGLPSTS